MNATREFLKPSAAEQWLNRAFGFMVGIGLGPSYCYLLKVRGRKTGKLYSTPVNLLDVNGKLLLVAPRGQTQWVRNAEASGAVQAGTASRRVPPLGDPGVWVGCPAGTTDAAVSNGRT